jgi:hypothetical protein
VLILYCFNYTQFENAHILRQKPYMPPSWKTIHAMGPSLLHGPLSDEAHTKIKCTYRGSPITMDPSSKPQLLYGHFSSSGMACSSGPLHTYYTFDKKHCQHTRNMMSFLSYCFRWYPQKFTTLRTLFKGTVSQIPQWCAGFPLLAHGLSRQWLHVGQWIIYNRSESWPVKLTFYCPFWYMIQ